MAEGQTAHKINKRPRTGDVLSGEDIDFPSLLLSAPVLEGLKSAGFEKPSPIQLKTIPLGRCGLDLIVQAKSGTGKTCVFSVIALENIILNTSALQVIVLAPTREIAVQIWEVIKSLGSAMPQLKCYTFIGGLPVNDDIPKLRKCHIAVGTPGRIKQLIETGHMNTDSVRLFVLDEADKLMHESFQETINWIYSTLPETKQMLALSATYPEVLAQHLTAYMCNPTFVRLNASDPALLGIRQYYKSVAFHPLPQKTYEVKAKFLMNILSSVTFHQCLVFSNFQTRAETLSNLLNSKGWPATFISGSQDQKQRLTAMAKLKKFHCRVLISTDLTSRGIDAENVNLVINLDIPRDHETYLHRIGRAGRFGTYGAAITLTCDGKELEELAGIEKKCNTRIAKLPEPLPEDLARSSGYVNWEEYIVTEQLVTQPTKLTNPPHSAQAKQGKNKKKKHVKKDKKKLEEVDTEIPVNGRTSGESVKTELEVDTDLVRELKEKCKLDAKIVDSEENISNQITVSQNNNHHGHQGQGVEENGAWKVQMHPVEQKVMVTKENTNGDQVVPKCVRVDTQQNVPSGGQCSERSPTDVDPQNGMAENSKPRPSKPEAFSIPRSAYLRRAVSKPPSFQDIVADYDDFIKNDKNINDSNNKSKLVEFPREDIPENVMENFTKLLKFYEYEKECMLRGTEVQHDVGLSQYPDISKQAEETHGTVLDTSLPVEIGAGDGPQNVQQSVNCDIVNGTSKVGSSEKSLPAESFPMETLPEDTSECLDEEEIAFVEESQEATLEQQVAQQKIRKEKEKMVDTTLGQEYIQALGADVPSSSQDSQNESESLTDTETSYSDSSTFDSEDEQKYFMQSKKVKKRNKKKYMQEEPEYMEDDTRYYDDNYQHEESNGLHYYTGRRRTKRRNNSQFEYSTGANQDSPYSGPVPDLWTQQVQFSNWLSAMQAVSHAQQCYQAYMIHTQYANHYQWLHHQTKQHHWLQQICQQQNHYIRTMAKMYAAKDKKKPYKY